MKIFKKIIILIAISTITIATLIGSVPKNLFINSNDAPQTPIKVAVFLYRANDNYISEVRKNLENIQKENEGKVEFTFFDGIGNQVIQNESIDKALNKNFDLFIVNLVDTKVDAIKDIFNKIVQKNIPLILEGTPTQDIINLIRPYKRTIFIGSDTKQSGVLQGKIIVDSWNANKQAIDKNNDNVLQYIMLSGKINSPGAVDRTKYSISTINDAGIKTKELALKFCDWEKECAKTNVESLFLNYSNKIEAIIANNDAMAIGAIEALQKYGYNKGNKEKNILVVGVDAIPEAQELVNKGFMTGTVIQDARAEAEALYSVGMNLAYGKAPLEGTNYMFDESGIIIRMPYKEYVKP
jgi:methyl-galactoside transport system substrate-binding protein